MPAWRRPGPERVLAVMTLIDSIGTGVFLASNVIYFKHFVGLSAGEVSVGISAAGVAGLVAMGTMGPVADRFGHRRVFILLSLVQAAGYAGYVFVDGFLSFFALVTFMGFVDFGKSPAREALISSATGQGNRVGVRAVLRTMFNVGFSVGSGLSTLLLTFDGATAKYAFVLINAASFLVGAVVAMRLPAADPIPPKPGVKRLRALRNVPFLTATAITGVLSLHITLLMVVLPLWVLSRTAAPPAIVGVILIGNTIVTVLFQVRMTRGVETLRDGSGAAWRASVALAVSCALIGLAAGDRAWLSVALLLAGALALTVGEMVQAASRWAIGVGLAPEHAQAEYLGAFNMSIAGQSMLGPVFCTALVLGWGLTGWLVLAGILLLAGLATGPAVEAAHRRLAGSEPDRHEELVSAHRA
ncbi:MFS transporter [Paractinoplanes lichenicola]|nr:MFS transporter [Actinoplanes lichenicola]